jgi:hypothetical protein
LAHASCVRKASWHERVAGAGCGACRLGFRGGVLSRLQKSIRRSPSHVAAFQQLKQGSQQPDPLEPDWHVVPGRRRVACWPKAAELSDATGRQLCNCRRYTGRAADVVGRASLTRAVEKRF